MSRPECLLHFSQQFSIRFSPPITQTFVSPLSTAVNRISLLLLSIFSSLQL
ncbi:hypothetical protein FGIG_12338 [Fasciola gigantica]|uniref:Uncharacterized protein n=1 Tax=Fasciola gigantica TaxID=46835 RepID=A0A504Z055_FASGI|nr:hypothetical protein FGIG_12338 [Fasciola gigantica]